MKKTLVVKGVEHRYNRDLYDMLLEWRYGARPTSTFEMSNRLGVSLATLNKWLKEYNLQYKQLASEHVQEDRVRMLQASHS